MLTRSFALIAALVASASTVAGCSAADGSHGHDASSAPPWQLRVVTSSAAGPCTAPPLTSDAPGTACSTDGATTYELAESLGVVTPSSVTRGDRSAAQIVVQFDAAGAKTLSDVTGKAVDKQLALVLDGKVLSAPTVQTPITTGIVTLAFGTPSEADQVATSLAGGSTS